VSGFYFRDVPYRCQWADRNIVDGLLAGEVAAASDVKRHDFGFTSDEQYEFWARRTCGLACFESYMLYLKLDVPQRARLVEEAIAYGAYILRPDGVDGLIYRPFIKLINERYGISGRLMPNCSVEDVAKEVASGAMVMCSVSPEIRNPAAVNERKGGHLVLVHGADDQHFQLHNPSGYSWNQENMLIEIENFDRFFAGRAISLPVSG
jgi:hypothetical protein